MRTVFLLLVIAVALFCFFELNQPSLAIGILGGWLVGGFLAEVTGRR